MFLLHGVKAFKWWQFKSSRIVLYRTKGQVFICLQVARLSNETVTIDNGRKELGKKRLIATQRLHSFRDRWRYRYTGDPLLQRPTLIVGRGMTARDQSTHWQSSGNSSVRLRHKYAGLPKRLLPFRPGWHSVKDSITYNIFQYYYIYKQLQKSYLQSTWKKEKRWHLWKRREEPFKLCMDHLYPFAWSHRHTRFVYASDSKTRRPASLSKFAGGWRRFQLICSKGPGAQRISKIELLFDSRIKRLSLIWY